MKNNLYYFVSILFLTGCATVPYEQVLIEAEEGVFQGSQEGQEIELAKASRFAYKKRTTQRDLSLKDICERHGMDWQFDRVSQVVVLTKNNTQARALIGSQVIIFEKEGKVFLNAPLEMSEHGEIVVPNDFQHKVINIFDHTSFRSGNYNVAKINKIIIDAGHGGKDSGALGKSGVQEKDVVLDIAQRVGKLLRKEGIEIVYTRDKDEFISLQRRTEIASQEAADLFVSIHANSAEDRTANGVEVFHLRPLNKEERIEKQRLDNQRLLYKGFNVHSGNYHVENILDDLLYMNKQAESYVLAQDLSHKISKSVRTRNRGMKNSRFYVLRNTLVPAVLVEVGFLSNAKEEKNLKSKGYREKLARSIAESLVDYAQK